MSHIIESLEGSEIIKKFCQQEHFYDCGKKKIFNWQNLIVSVENIENSQTAIKKKTTLLNMIGGLDRPSEGKVFINEILISDLDDEELCIFRRKNIGVVFQNYNLLPVLNAYENIVLPQKLSGCEYDVDFIEEVAHFLGIKDKLMQMPTTLSGGQQQRVAIARALCMKPAIILADEPTGNLDSKASRNVIELMQQMAETYNQTAVIVTHSEEIAKRATRIIRMEDGNILNTKASPFTVGHLTSI